MPVYFAYGSNMDVAAMAVRCPRSTPMGLARLPRHRPDLSRQGYATVVRAARGDVWGLLWDLALSDVAALDRWEEVARGLYAKRDMPVVRAGGAAVRALIYFACDIAQPGPGAPPAYGAAIVQAARDIGLPTPYIETLVRLYGPKGAKASGGRP